MAVTSSIKITSLPKNILLSKYIINARTHGLYLYYHLYLQKILNKLAMLKLVLLRFWYSVYFIKKV